MNSEIEKYWTEFVKSSGIDEKSRYADCFYFGSHESSAKHLLDLVLKGIKTATCSSVDSFILTGIKLPEIGDYCVITDWSGEPKCIIQTVNKIELKFKEMTFDICKREGEDENLESWQNNHISFFNAEGSQLGYSFSWDMNIIFEDFEVVYMK